MADCMLHMVGGQLVPTSQMLHDQSDQPTNCTEHSPTNLHRLSFQQSDGLTTVTSFFDGEPN